MVLGSFLCNNHQDSIENIPLCGENRESESVFPWEKVIYMCFPVLSAVK